MYEIAMYGNHFWIFDLAFDWAKNLISRVPNKTENIRVSSKRNLSDIYEVIAWAAYKQKNYQDAIRYTEEEIKLHDTKTVRPNLE